MGNRDSNTVAGTVKILILAAHVQNMLPWFLRAAPGPLYACHLTFMQANAHSAGSGQTSLASLFPPQLLCEQVSIRHSNPLQRIDIRAPGAGNLRSAPPLPALASGYRTACTPRSSQAGSCWDFTWKLTCAWLLPLPGHTWLCSPYTWRN